jgi:dihydrofolate reductase
LIKDMRDSNVIVAVDEERGIGRGGEMPWSVPADYQFFKTMTYGGTVVVGRKTFENTGALPGRHFLVLTSDESKEDRDLGEDRNGYHTTVRFVHSFAEVQLRAMSCPKPIWIAGGQSVYEHYVGKSKNLYISRIPGTHDCDRFFPEPTEYSKIGVVPSEGFKFTRYALPRS